MAGLCWMAVVLVFSTSIGNSLAVDRSTLTVILKKITDSTHGINKQFSLAINIPVDQNYKPDEHTDNVLDKIKEALNKVPFASVKNKILQGDVYKVDNVVAATFKRNEGFDEHAEQRVLDNIQLLIRNSGGNILVLYSYYSPCSTKCANQDHGYNILKRIDNAIEKSRWKDRAFVFTEVYIREGQKPSDALAELGGTKIGQNNIFRCYYPKKGQFKCIKCFNNGVLSDECVKN